MTWNDGAMPRYCRCQDCEGPDPNELEEEDAMSEDTLVERLERHVNILGVCDHFEVRSVGPKIGLCLNCEMTGADHLCREAAARLTAQAEEIGRLRNGVGAALRSLDTALASDGAMGCEDIDLLTEARVELTAALKGQP